jgi:hypothetical protein
VPKGSYFHPRAFEASGLEFEVPPLLPDLSSETDDSEGCLSPKSTSPEPHVAIRVQGTRYPTPIPRTHSQEEFDHALSFLPHAPVPKTGLQKRRKSPHRPRRSVTFMESDATCDGCLGGF